MPESRSGSDSNKGYHLHISFEEASAEPDHEKISEIISIVKNSDTFVSHWSIEGGILSFPSSIDLE